MTASNSPRQRLKRLEGDGTAPLVAATLGQFGTVTGIGTTQIARQTADVVVDESATLTNLTGLVHTVVPGTYVYRAHLQTLATGNGGTKVAFKLTDTVLTSIQNTSLTSTASANAAARTTTATDQASLVAATSANLRVILEGTIVVGTGGTIQLQGAQNASHVDETTFYTGSTFELTRIA